MAELIDVESMTDEQALETLKKMKLTMGRGSAKTIFQQGILEAICHAIKALEEKVERESERKAMCHAVKALEEKVENKPEIKDCCTCKYETKPVVAEPCFSCIHGLCDETPNRTEKWEAKIECSTCKYENNKSIEYPCDVCGTRGPFYHDMWEAKE